MGLFVALSFGSAYPVAKPLVDAVDPFTFSAARYGLAGTLILLLAAMRGESLTIRLADVPVLVGLGLIGYTLFQGAWGVALSLSAPGKGVVLLATAPIFGALITTFGGERLGRARWLGILIAFTGVFVLINNSLTAMTLGGVSALGDGLFILAAFCWALFGALSRATLLRLGTLRATGWCAVFGSLALVPAAIPGAMSQDWNVVSPTMMLGFLHVSVVVGSLGLLAWSGGLARLGLSRIVVYLYLSPVAGVTLSGLMLDQWLSGVQLLGGLTVIAGVWMAQRAPGRSAG